MSAEPEMRDSTVGANEPSVSTALEHLVAASQGVITKRIDLALLEGQEVLSRALRRALLASLTMLLALAAWLALMACLIEWVGANQAWLLRLGLFALVNGAAAVVLAMATRSVSQPTANAGGAHSEIVNARPRLEGRPIRGSD